MLPWKWKAARNHTMSAQEYSRGQSMQTPTVGAPTGRRAGERILETRRLRLRRPTRADVPQVQHYALREVFYRYLDMAVPTLESVEQYLETLIAAWEQPHCTERVYVIEPKETGRLAGLIRIGIDADDRGKGTIGFSLDSDYQGRGYATEALAEVVRLGFGELGLHRISATVDTRNEASWKVLERAGFRREKRMAGTESIRGVATDSYLYGISTDRITWRKSTWR